MAASFILLPRDERQSFLLLFVQSNAEWSHVCLMERDCDSDSWIKTHFLNLLNGRAPARFPDINLKRWFFFGVFLNRFRMVMERESEW